MERDTRPVLIAGPTASGKSALALALAEHFGGAVINADSQQVFADWRVLTARPSQADEARVPHRLFGHLPLDTDYSVGAWLRELRPVLADCRAAGLRPIIVGGTGLYFKALTEGLAEIPQVPPETRQRAEAELERLGLAGFAAQLAERDPATAAETDLANPMRVLRAWEVLESTGRGLAAWRADRTRPVIALEDAAPIVLAPDRAALYRRCDARFDEMLADGALEEAEAVRARDLPAHLPGMKALAAPELIAHLDGALSLDEARSRAKTATRRYAKRQLTWARNQMPGWPRVATSDVATALAAIG